MNPIKCKRTTRQIGPDTRPRVECGPKHGPLLRAGLLGLILQTALCNAQNLAQNPEYAVIVEKLRNRLRAWMKSQGDKETVFNEPYLLNRPGDWKPGKYIKKPKGKKKKKKKKP